MKVLIFIFDLLLLIIGAIYALGIFCVEWLRNRGK